MAFHICSDITMGTYWLIVSFGLCLLVTSAGSSSLSLSTDYRPLKSRSIVINSNQVRMSDVGAENRLITYLLSNYSKYGRPISDVNQPVYVSISYYMTQLMGLEEKSQILTTFGWLETTWRDEFLTWNPDEFEGLNQVVLSPELVWLPDFGVENSAKAIYDEQFFKRFRVSVSHDGHVNWVPGGKFITSCQLDITYYPFDDQECHIDLVDWAYHGLQVALINASHEIGLDAYTESGEWSLLKTKAMANDMYYESDPEVPYPMVRFIIYLRRKPMFYTINIITPCITMSLLALLVFYLPPDSGEKVSLGITVLLSFSVFLLLVAENVPKTSEFVPLLGIYLTLIMAMTAMSILICVVVLNLHHRDPNAPLPSWLRHLTYDLMAPLVFMRELTKQAGPVVYQLCEVKKKDRMGHTVHNNGEVLENMSDNTQSCLDDIDNSYDVNYAVCGDATRQYEILEEVLKHVRVITSKLNENEDQDTLTAEWKIAAKILDRFFLGLFILLVIVSSVVMLYVYPLLGRHL